MQDTPLLLGHRGARATRSVVENTFASFDLALAHGCDGFEFDVRLSATGHAVVCHDEKISGIPVCLATSAEVAHLPLLEGVLDRYRDCFLDIELKVPGLEAKVLNCLRDRPNQHNFVISSFLPPVLLELQARKPGLPLGVICDTRQQLSAAERLPVDYIMLEGSLVNRSLVSELRGSSKKVFAWTINDAESMLRLAEWNVDAIISDDTQLLVRTLRPSQKSNHASF